MMSTQTDDIPVAIHLVDDDPQQVDELAACLEAVFAQVNRHHSGTELLDALYASDGPCIVVADMQMPDVTGWGVAASIQKLRARGRPIGLVIVTGFPEQVTVRRALMLQIDDLLEKPVSAEDLLDTLGRLQQSLISPLSSFYPTDKLSSLESMAAAFFHLFDVCDRRLPATVRSETHLRMILYCISRHLSRRTVSVSSVCYASGAPLSTAMRKLQDLVDLDLFSKSEDAADRRRVAIRPTDDLLARMQGIVHVANDIGSPDMFDRDPSEPDLESEAE